MPCVRKSSVMISMLSAAVSAASGSFAVPRAEFAKCHRQITGAEPAEGAVRDYGRPGPGILRTIGLGERIPS